MTNRCSNATKVIARVGLHAQPLQHSGNLSPMKASVRSLQLRTQLDQQILALDGVSHGHINLVNHTVSQG